MPGINELIEVWDVRKFVQSWKITVLIIIFYFYDYGNF